MSNARINQDTAQNVFQQSSFPSLQSANQQHESLPPPSAWNKQNNKPLGTKPPKQDNSNQQRQPKRSWIHGTSSSVNNNISHQLKFICLGVRTGADETEESLKKEIEQWKYPKDLKVEAVRKSDFSATFRVQYNSPASLYTKWQDPTVWPARMSATEWRGNPKAQLKPLPERQYTKRIYIGNLSETATTEELTANMQYIYREEIRNNIIQSVETHLNYAGMERATKMKAQNPAYEMTKSACVILTSFPGQPLTEVGLKLDEYDEKIQRTVRRWNGPTPRQKSKPTNQLKW